MWFSLRLKHAKRSRYYDKGFTLMEIGIVIIIIGLLVGGLVASQSLIRSMKVQSIITDVSTYQTALSQFRQKYNAVAGDMANATSYWGTNPNCAGFAAGSGSQTCNGNGNGQIENSTTGESFLAWQHLANGGFIPGQYIGAVADGTTCVPGSTCPGGSLNQQQAYWLQYFPGPISIATWSQPPGHYLLVGTYMSDPTLSTSTGPLLSGAEAQLLDSKVDDGYPGTGLWKSYVGISGGYICNVNNTYNLYYGKTPECGLEININF